MLNATKTVREFAVESPEAVRVLERLGIDYCCGGGETLDKACEKAGVSVADLARSVEDEARRASTSTERDWSSASLTELTSYIVEKHHVFTREEVDRLAALISKVVAKHGENHPELNLINSIFEPLREELLAHMFKEERVLFPYVAQLEEAIVGTGTFPAAFFGTVENPIRVMRQEHDTAGEALRKMREASDGYRCPPDACPSYEALYRGLEDLEKDLHRHIHLENNILFPRAIEAEAGAFAI